MCTRRLPDGSEIPGPDHHPTDLIMVQSVYGRRYRVRQAHLDSDKAMLPLFNQYGARLQGARNRGQARATHLHRENIAS